MERTRIASLDGLRAVAVGLVILFHYWETHFLGGFVGVDIFFVLSGFLITRLLLNESTEGGIDYPAFFRRRLARLAPALLVVVAVTGSVVLAFHLGSWRAFLGDAAWVLTYTSNWKRAFIERFGDSTFFNHTWSLAIEEQFYLSWPFILAFLSSKVPRTRLLLILTVMIFAVIVWRWALLYLGATPFRLYHGFDTRSDELLVGCALAVAMSIRPYRKWCDDILQRFPHLPMVALVSLPLVGWLWLIDPVVLPVIGGTILALGAAVIIANCDLSPQSRLSRLLSLRPLTYIGAISYGIYLWHIPVKSFFLTSGIGFSFPQKVLCVIITLLAASASFYAIERPVLRAKFLRRASSVMQNRFVHNEQA